MKRSGDITEAIKNSLSIAETLRKLNLRPVGGNYITIKRFIQNNDISTLHWTGQGWNKGKQLKQIKNYSRPHIIKAKLAVIRGWKCEECNLSYWRDKPIPLECHHKDFDRTNNEETNLVLLCRNCHFTIHDKR
jgi:hypothetical protein